MILYICLLYLITLSVANKDDTKGLHYIAI